MSSRPILTPFSVITNEDMASDVISDVTIIQNLSMLSYDISWTGSPVGTISVQVSNTYRQNAAGVVQVPGNWVDLPLAGPTVISGSVPISGGPGNGFIDIDELGSYAMRLVYTATSGDGTLNAMVNGKVS